MAIDQKKNVWQTNSWKNINDSVYPQSHALCLYINGAHAHVCYRTKTDLQVYSTWATLKMFRSSFIRIQLSGIK